MTDNFTSINILKHVKVDVLADHSSKQITNIPSADFIRLCCSEVLGLCVFLFFSRPRYRLCPGILIHHKSSILRLCIRPDPPIAARSGLRWAVRKLRSIVGLNDARLFFIAQFVRGRWLLYAGTLIYFHNLI